MPLSPSSRRETRSIPHLFQIIELEPEKDPWCAGYAYTQRRRCHARTNVHSRSRAMQLLRRGTEEMRAGRSIDGILEELAHHALCTRHHQSQAGGLAQCWKEKVQPFIQAQSRPSRRRATETRTQLHRAPVTESGSALREDEINIPSQLRNLWTISDFFARANSLFDSIHAPFRIGNSKTKPVHPKIVRRPITGLCPICLESLQKSGSFEKDDKLYFCSDSETENYEGFVEQKESMIMYCKSKCGNNFHLKCLQKWLKHTQDNLEPTCPICRSIWTN
ncbi:hypothetical protein N7540_008408 [Penicillium herquei]|nr:hypothetical protein N7540_008408 [Penicillium herquei]